MHGLPSELTQITIGWVPGVLSLKEKRKNCFPPSSCVEIKNEWTRVSNPRLYIFDVYRDRWTWHVARMGEERGVYRVLVGIPEGRRPLGRPRRRWVDNIRMDLQEVGCG